MLRWSYIVAVVGSLALFGCSGAAKPAQAPESNPWADYKGTYAAGGSGEAPSAPAAKSPESRPTAPDAKSASAPEPKPKKGDKPRKIAKGGEPKSEPRPEMKPDAGTDAKAMYGLPSEAKADDAAAEPAKKITKKRAAGAKPKTKKPATANR